MRTGYTQIDEWPVRPYSKRELAMAYAPEISPVSALNRLAEWMRYNDRLTRELAVLLVRRVIVGTKDPLTGQQEITIEWAF